MHLFLGTHRQSGFSLNVPFNSSTVDFNTTTGSSVGRQPLSGLACWPSLPVWFCRQTDFSGSHAFPMPEITSMLAYSFFFSCEQSELTPAALFYQPWTQTCSCDKSTLQALSPVFSLVNCHDLNNPVKLVQNKSCAWRSNRNRYRHPMTKARKPALKNPTKFTRQPRAAGPTF